MQGSSDASDDRLPSRPAPVLPDERERELCRRAEEQLHGQRRRLEGLVDNLNEGVYHDARLMLYEDDHGRLELGMAALCKLEERVRKGTILLHRLDCDRDQLDFTALTDEYPRQHREFREQRRVLAAVTGRLTHQLELDASVLASFRELVGRMGAKLELSKLVHDARAELNRADAARQVLEGEGQDHVEGQADNLLSQAAEWAALAAHSAKAAHSATRWF
ncbi:hypothetical protein T492DRAFT_1002420 [Pavlovales sp. CCMP2436]|nr:hypothetical protein T492DRAFT_1002420 [Pavlovales sp. CCMP2436]|mmetsp:Transcript_6792/g.17785  ORF Transcript_6792/g.17785 Transcript_6792/m.17785 type:complete len:220 (+) Transcript_6792:143-802(+)